MSVSAVGVVALMVLIVRMGVVMVVRREIAGFPIVFVMVFFPPGAFHQMILSELPCLSMLRTI